jgi:preprotein translocase subunit SecB
MNAGPLLLEGYYFTEVSFQSCFDHELNGDNTCVTPDDLMSSVNCSVDPENLRRWSVELRIELPTVADRRPAYTFKVGAIGFFEVVETYPAEQREQLVMINGSSMLYSAARELLAAVSGRGPFPAIVLPSVSFQPPLHMQSSERIEDHTVWGPKVEYGFPQQREKFGATYLRLLQSMASLKVAWDYILKEANPRTRAAKIMYGLGRIPLEDEFQAIILLCANGYSNTARVTLRALFEKVVTLLYLKKHPNEMDAFIDYSWVDRQKQSNRIAPVLGKNPGRRSAKIQHEIAAGYGKVRQKYANGRWTKKDLLGMAKDVGIDMAFVELAYYGGIEEAHPKEIAILKRMEFHGDGSLWWKDELPDIDDARVTLMLAHYFVLKAHDALCDYFKIEVPEKVMSQCVTDYFESWGLRPPEQGTNKVP